MLFVTFFCFVFLRVLFLLFFCFVLVLLLFFIETDCYFREKRHTYSDASILFPSVSMSAGDDDCSVRPHFSSSRGIWLQIINGRKRPRHHICEANIALWSTELPTHSFVNFISEINYIYIYIYICICAIDQLQKHSATFKKYTRYGRIVMFSTWQMFGKFWITVTCSSNITITIKMEKKQPFAYKINTNNVHQGDNPMIMNVSCVRVASVGI